MKFNKSLLLFAALLFSMACSDSEEPEVIETLTFINFTLEDHENHGDASDIYLSIALSGTVEQLSELRLFLINTQEVVDEQAALSSGFSQQLSNNASINIFLNEELRDTEGEVVEEGVPYQAVLQGTFLSGNTIVSGLSNTLTLSNEIVVTTPLLTGAFNGMEDIVIDQEGNLYVAGGNTAPNSVYQVTPEGVSSVFSTGHHQPVGIDIDGDGNLYVSNLNATSIQKITSSGTVSTFADDPALTGGGGIAIDQEGALFNAFYAGSTIYRITESTIENHLTDGVLQGLVGMAYDLVENKLYVANFNTGRISHIAEDGTMTLIADVPLSIGHLAYHDGSFYATGWFEHQVMRVSLDGEITATMGTGSQGSEDGTNEATFDSPNGIAVSADGKYVYVSQGNGQLRKIVMQRAD